MADLKEKDHKGSGPASAEPNNNDPSKSDGIHVATERSATGIAQLNLETDKTALEEQAAQEDFHTLQQKVQALEQENKLLKQGVQTLMESCQLHEENAQFYEEQVQDYKERAQLSEERAQTQQTLVRKTKIHEELEREYRAIRMKAEAMENLFAKYEVFEESSAIDRMDEYAVGRTFGIFLDMYKESPAPHDEDCAILARFTSRVIDTITRHAEEKTKDA